MLSDRLTQVSNGQDFTGLSGNVASQHLIDLQIARDIARGMPLFWHIHIDDTFTGGSSMVAYAVSVNSSSNLLDASQTVLGSTMAIPIAALTAGGNILVPIGPQTRTSNPVAGVLGLDGWQWQGVVYTLGGTMTGGKVTTRMTTDHDVGPLITPIGKY